MFSANNQPIVQSYNHYLYQELNKIENNREELEKEVRKIIIDEGMKNKTYYQFIDDLPINEDENREYIEYESERRKLIKNLISDPYVLNEKKSIKILQARNNLLENRVKRIKKNNVGTALNVLRDLYHDIYRDLGFAKEKWKKPEEDMSYYTVYLGENNYNYEKNDVINIEFIGER